MKLTVQLKVSEKTNKCKVCGRTYNAGFNASLNIARRAMSLLAGACNPPSVGLRDDGRKLPTKGGE